MPVHETFKTDKGAVPEHTDDAGFRTTYVALDNLRLGHK
jgi:hypothetical protein